MRTRHGEAAVQAARSARSPGQVQRCACEAGVPAHLRGLRHPAHPRDPGALPPRAGRGAREGAAPQGARRQCAGRQRRCQQGLVGHEDVGGVRAPLQEQGADGAGASGEVLLARPGEVPAPQAAAAGPRCRAQLRAAGPPDGRRRERAVASRAQGAPEQGRAAGVGLRGRQDRMGRAAGTQRARRPRVLRLQARGLAHAPSNGARLLPPLRLSFRECRRLGSELSGLRRGGP
mmetsp:Transcript_86958/g.243731  ORF Transcript_86958/g.243731 Transcript_86958/m.243731 type:complete len:232 (+) Transcript_86958:196-891(+)